MFLCKWNIILYVYNAPTMETILITGASGFIGYHVAQSLLKSGHRVIGVDNENDYYDVKLKEDRRQLLTDTYPEYIYYKASIETLSEIEPIFAHHKPERVLNLAAQAGVRYSIENPFCYIQTNIVGFHNVIELAKQHGCKHFVYASSASIYWGNPVPFRVEDMTEKPLSLYGATKKANELIAHSYHSMFDLHTTWLRFFNVYGPRGRPDGAFFIFLKNISEGKPIDVFNYGESLRNFTYIDDIVNAVTNILFQDYQYEIFNLGNTRQVKLLYMIECLEKSFGKTTEKNLLPAAVADISESDVDISHTIDALGWTPTVDIEEGVAQLVDWYKKYYLS